MLKSNMKYCTCNRRRRNRRFRRRNNPWVSREESLRLPRKFHRGIGHSSNYLHPEDYADAYGSPVDQAELDAANLGKAPLGPGGEMMWDIEAPSPTTGKHWRVDSIAAPDRDTALSIAKSREWFSQEPREWRGDGPLQVEDLKAELEDSFKHYTPSDTHLCRCDSLDLFRYGCQCGGRRRRRNRRFRYNPCSSDHKRRPRRFNPEFNAPTLRNPSEERMRDKEEAAETEKRSEHDIKLEIISNSLASLAKTWENYLNKPGAERTAPWRYTGKNIDDIAFYGPFAGSSYNPGLRNDRWYGNVLNTGRGSIPTGERINLPFEKEAFESKHGKPVPVAAPTNLAVITYALLEHYPEYLYEDWYNQRIDKIAQKMRNDLRKLVEAYGLDETVGDVHERLPTWPVTNEELEREVIRSSGEASLMHHDWQSLVDDDTWRRNPDHRRRPRRFNPEFNVTPTIFDHADDRAGVGRRWGGVTFKRSRSTDREPDVWDSAVEDYEAEWGKGSLGGSRRRLRRRNPRNMPKPYELATVGYKGASSKVPRAYKIFGVSDYPGNEPGQTRFFIQRTSNRAPILGTYQGMGKRSWIPTVLMPFNKREKPFYLTWPSAREVLLEDPLQRDSGDWRRASGEVPSYVLAHFHLSSEEAKRLERYISEFHGPKGEDVAGSNVGNVDPLYFVDEEYLMLNRVGSRAKKSLTPRKRSFLREDRGFFKSSGRRYKHNPG